MTLERKTHQYFWEYKYGNSERHYSPNFKKINIAKKWIKSQIKKHNDILGRNTLYYTKNILSDVQVGYYGISGKWYKYK